MDTYSHTRTTASTVHSREDKPTQTAAAGTLELGTKIALRANSVCGGRSQGRLHGVTSEKGFSFQQLPKQIKGSGEEPAPPREHDAQEHGDEFVNGVLGGRGETQ